MKLSLLVPLLLLVSCGTRVGYVDPERSVQQTDEWREVQSGVQAYAEEHQGELDAAKAAAQKARDGKAPADEILAKQTAYDVLTGKIDQEAKRRLNAGGQKIFESERVLFESLAAKEGVDIINPTSSAFYINPKADLTTALAKHYNEDKVHMLQAKVADYEAKQKRSPPLAKQ